MSNLQRKIIAVLGPTSSGKSDYAIRLAREVDGEVISADSRQVYRGMDMGTGKVTRDLASCHPELVSGSRMTLKEMPKQVRHEKKSTFFSNGIRHHLLDVASPKRDYNVTHFLRDARKAITNIEKRGKIPILCGGTTFWIETLLFGTTFPKVKPDRKLRARLGRLSVDELFSMLETRDPDRAATIDGHNKIRLIRALEIVESLGKVPPLSVGSQPSTADGNTRSPCHSREGGNPGSTEHSSASDEMMNDDIKIVALSPPKEILHARIESRLKERLDQGMLDEVRRLHDEGISWKRLENFGLEYRWCARHLQGKVSREEMEAGILAETKRYAKRQLTFLRRLQREGLEMEWKSETSAFLNPS